MIRPGQIVPFLAQLPVDEVATRIGLGAFVVRFCFRAAVPSATPESQGVSETEATP